MSTELVERTAQRLRDAEADAQRDYWRAVRQTASGEGEPDLLKLMDCCRVLGRNIADFERDCAAVGERFRLRELVEKRDGLRERAAVCEAAIKKADDALTAAEKRHAETIAPHESELTELTRKLREADAAEEALKRGATLYPWLAAEQCEAEQHAQALAIRAAEIRAAIKRLEAETQHLHAQVAGDVDLTPEQELSLSIGSGADRDNRQRGLHRQLSAQAAKHAQRAEELRATLGDVERQQAEAEKARKALVAKFLDP